MPTARERILDAATTLLADKDALAISTRDICAEAQVGMPEIYRQFGDKQGLLTAVADLGFQKFLASKRANPTTDDPVADLKTAWDSHTTFALANPHLYRLMFTPAGSSKPQGISEARELLHAALGRCLNAGRLRLPIETAGHAILSANVGVCLMALSFPDPYADPSVSATLRDTVIGKATGEEEDPRLGTATLLAQQLLGTLTGQGE